MTETLISSRDNPIFKRLKKLADSSRARRDTQMSLLDGDHLLTAYLDAGGVPTTLLRAQSCPLERVANLTARCPQTRCIAVPDAMLTELTPVATPTGVLAEAAWLTPPVVSTTPLVIVLDAIQDPGNLGAMLRTGAAAGATLAVLSRGCHDAWSPKALRGGQGAQFVLPLLLNVDVAEWLTQFDGLSLALALGASRTLYDCEMTQPLAVVVGNEGAGLSPAVRAAAREAIGIPMAGRVESLNAAAALAVAVFEAARQRAGGDSTPLP